MNNSLILTILLVIALSASVGIYYTMTQSPNAAPSHSEPTEDGTYHMVLGENGYEPQELVIPKGSTVVFSTTRGRHHWPASNMHPNHQIYSEFDPKEAVPPDETWSFTFDRVGSWNLHDHLRSYYRGTIIVTE